MRRLAILVILTLCFASPGFASYSESYIEGYQEGYQYGEGPGLKGIKPPAPIAPVPELRRRSDQDAYNRGFLDGQRESKI